MSNETRPDPRAVRHPGGPVVCADCGCRLNAAGEGWRHYRSETARDARGCRRDCVPLVHRLG